MVQGQGTRAPILAEGSSDEQEVRQAVPCRSGCQPGDPGCGGPHRQRRGAAHGAIRQHQRRSPSTHQVADQRGKIGPRGARSHGRLQPGSRLGLRCRHAHRSDGGQPPCRASVRRRLPAALEYGRHHGGSVAGVCGAHGVRPLDAALATGARGARHRPTHCRFDAGEDPRAQPPTCRRRHGRYPSGARSTTWRSTYATCSGASTNSSAMP